MAYKPKEKILTQEQLCEWWGITGDQLDNLRLKKGLPYVELVKGRYVFVEKRIADWLLVNETINKGSQT